MPDNSYKANIDDVYDVLVEISEKLDKLLEVKEKSPGIPDEIHKKIQEEVFGGST